MDILLKLLEASTILTGFTSALSKVITSAAKLEDRWAYLVTLLVGLVLTAAGDYMAMSPSTSQAWVLVGFHGLGVGLLSCGLFKLPGAVAVNIDKARAKQAIKDASSEAEEPLSA